MPPVACPPVRRVPRRHPDGRCPIGVNASSVLQPLGYIIAAVVAATLTYFLARRMEPYRSGIVWDSRRREIRYSLLHEKRLSACERLAGLVVALMRDLARLQLDFDNAVGNRDQNLIVKRNRAAAELAEAKNRFCGAANEVQFYLTSEVDSLIERFAQSLSAVLSLDEWTLEEGRQPEPSVVHAAFSAARAAEAQMVLAFRRLAEVDEK